MKVISATGVPAPLLQAPVIPERTGRQRSPCIVVRGGTGARGATRSRSTGGPRRQTHARRRTTGRLLPVVWPTVRTVDSADHRTSRATSQGRSQHRGQRGRRVPAVQRRPRSPGSGRVARRVPEPARLGPAGEPARDAPERAGPRTRQRGWASPRPAIPGRPAATLPEQLLRRADRSSGRIRAALSPESP